ncbi:TDG/mug DNA glycosylase family protein [Motilibacter peucedani]|uniref:TDG/mug DNA glycosylase family protein n=1 Tax=Motilibacter peucedani TaxID=598650 RepID=A0A420XUW8_9ACTN|nr:G/U mismatch-specific DNA glycosylase [Motilibacter peucedani]RKS80531.1 TDG/mug DNA glycosylase family protein [Motilibacter peucedani]
MSPSRAELLAFEGATLPDVAAPGLRVLFCGINPGLWTAWSQTHFGRPGNRFWPALHLSGFTPRLFSPAEQHLLLPLGLGITNVVPRASATAAELTREELAAGGEALRARVADLAPRTLAVLGVGAYRTAFARPRAALGLQPEGIGPTAVWVLPNPSGLNAHFTLPALAELFAELRAATE